MEFSYPIRPYSEHNLPDSGKHIVAQTTSDHIIVYQAYKAETAHFAVKHQQFGGAFSYNRMSWVKPNFLWMMYRSGWAMKEGQEHVLAIWISKSFFEEILRDSVISSFEASEHKLRDDWQKELDAHEVRLQWDPDHDPYGKALNRRAVQLGLKGTMLKKYGKEQIGHIRNITPFVHEQFEHVKSRRLDQLMVPVEQVYRPSDETIIKRISLD
jgi:hypothetical protein